MISISCEIRKIANFIELDNTPLTEEDVDRNKKRLDEGGSAAQKGSIDKESTKSEYNESNTKKEKSVKSKKPAPLRVEEAKIESTAKPKIKGTRKQHECKKKWNSDNKRESMKDYMREYRSDGKDDTVPGLRLKKPKKPKIN